MGLEGRRGLWIALVPSIQKSLLMGTVRGWVKPSCSGLFYKCSSARLQGLVYARKCCRGRYISIYLTQEIVAACRKWYMQMTGNLGRIQAELFNQATQIHRNQNSLILTVSNLPIFDSFFHIQTGFKKLLLTKGKTHTAYSGFTAHSKSFEARILFGFYKMYVQDHSIFLCLIPWSFKRLGNNYFQTTFLTTWS